MGVAWAGTGRGVTARGGWGLGLVGRVEPGLGCGAELGLGPEAVSGAGLTRTGAPTSSQVNHLRQSRT